MKYYISLLLIITLINCSIINRKPKNVSATPVDSCITWTSDSTLTTIINRCAQYTVKYPNGLKMEHNRNTGGLDSIKLIIPPIGDKVTNQIMIKAFPPPHFTTSHWRDQICVKKYRKLNLRTPGYTSFIYSESMRYSPDKLKGILTWIDVKDGSPFANYEIHYYATESTFDKYLYILNIVEESFDPTTIYDKI